MWVKTAYEAVNTDLMTHVRVIEGEEREKRYPDDDPLVIEVIMVDQTFPLVFTGNVAQSVLTAIGFPQA